MSDPKFALSLNDMAAYIADRLGETQADAIYDAVHYFYLKIREEEIQRDIARIFSSGACPLSVKEFKKKGCPR